jgi:apolipoprotein N-acyltransferase
MNPASALIQESSQASPGHTSPPDTSPLRQQGRTAAASQPRVPTPWLVLPALTGTLLWLCFYPVGWGFLGWVALVPLLFLVRLQARPWQIYFGSHLGGSLFFWAILQWMTVADYRMVYTWAMLASYCALYFPMALFLIRRLDRATGWSLAVTAPVVWTALEFVRSFFGTGFAWYFLGHTQHHYLAVIQVADLGGVYVISFVMAAVSGWLVEILSIFPQVRAFCRQPAVPRIGPRLGPVVAGLVAALLFYGGCRLNQNTFRAGPRVALLQGNLDQRIRNEATGHSAPALRTAERHYLDLCRMAAQLSPDLIVWPETSFPYPWYELPSELKGIPAETLESARLQRGFLREMAADMKTNQLVGLNCEVIGADGSNRLYNSALLLSPAGNSLGHYHKMHPVPFGEYVPLRDWLPFMEAFAPYKNFYGIVPGDKFTRLQFDRYRIGVIICYEDTDPFLARQYGREHADGPAVDFLVNISNDGWFDGSCQHAEHLAISRFRAVETRRPLVRAVNMGISAVIDSNGRVLRPKEFEYAGAAKVWAVTNEPGGEPDLPESHWKDFTKVPGVLLATIPLDDRVSLYAYGGDWLPCGCWLLVGGVWLWWRFKRSMAKRPIADGPIAGAA